MKLIALTFGLLLSSIGLADNKLAADELANATRSSAAATVQKENLGLLINSKRSSKQVK